MLYPVGIPKSSEDYLNPHILIKLTQIKFTNFPQQKNTTPRFKSLRWKITQRKQEQLLSDLEVPVRLHPCGVVLNIAFETLD